MNLTTYTLTFGDCAENHVGMQKIGIPTNDGYTINEMIEICENFKNNGYECMITDLSDQVPDSEKAYLLVIKNGLNFFVNPELLFDEHRKLKHDKKAFIDGRVVNKKSRHNLCFGEFSQEPDYKNRKGRIVNYKNVHCTYKLINNLPSIFGKKSEKLVLEANYYNNNKICGIGYHGDTERKIVIGARLGGDMPLVFQWYKGGVKIGKKITINLEHGDMYLMSSKTVGNDWKNNKILTLRHAAGCAKYID